MQRYRRDNYEDLDEYEEDEEELEEEDAEDEEEVEDPKPTKEELEYLQLRQRLKESIRKQKKKENGSALNNSHEKNKKLPYDNYGSFFGPSKPVISQRVIQESKSLLENQHLAARISNSNSSTKKSSASKPAGSKVGVHIHPPKVMNGLKVKPQKLKDTRDYSFLLSDDAELPAPTKEPLTRNVHVSHSEARSAPIVQKSKQLSSNTGRQILSGREERKPASMNGNMQWEERKPASMNGNMQREERKPASMNGNMQREERKPASMNGNMQRRPGPHMVVSAGKSNLTPATSRNQLGSNNGNGPGRPVAKGMPSKMPVTSMEKKISAPTAKHYAPPTKNSLPGVKKSLPSKNLAISKQPLQQKKQYQEPSRGKLIPKQPVASSKPQMNKAVKQISSHSSLQQHRPKKKPVRRYSDDEDDQGAEAISEIRRLFGYNPGKYTDYSDDSDMEANFDDIMAEEKRSSLIARKEDEEELRKIEEEERRVREARKRKLSHR